MIRANIDVGQEYACYTEPRKGIEDLSTIDEAFSVKVLSTTHLRYVESTGLHKPDGVMCERTDIPPHDRGFFVVKARDILMPWRDYQSQRQEREERIRRETQERTAKLRSMEERRDAIVKILMEDYDLLGEGLGGSRDFTAYNFYTPNEDDAAVGLTLSGAEKLLSSISDRVYRILSEQE